MERFNLNARTGLAVCSAMALAIVAGVSSHAVAAHAASSLAASEIESGADKGIGKLEKRVAKSPRNAAARVELAQAYLAAGRFQSAATTFEDAASLGDDSPRTGLGLALAYIASGRQDDALNTLDRWRDRIPASDLGLAVALAGRPAQGVELLTGALRGGDATAKTRQNLAYAYALDGRWAEARLIAAQDVSADQIDARMGDWASRSRPDQYQERIAALLGAPQRLDAGQPVSLALNAPAQPVRMASAETVEAVAPVPVPEVPMPVATAELPPAVAVQEAAPEQPFQAAFAPETAAVRADEPSVAVPSVARAAKPVAKPQGRVRVAAAINIPRPVPARAAAARGTHYVQLGSFSSLANAKRAWAVFVSRNPALKGHAMRITEADVRGRHFFRVAAEGFDRGSAQSMCSTVRQRGGACLAYAGTRGLPGTLPAAGRGATMLAQR